MTPGILGIFRLCVYIYTYIHIYIYIYREREIVNGGYERNDHWLRDDLVLILIWVFF